MLWPVAGVVRRSVWLLAFCLGGPTSSRCGPTTGRESAPGHHHSRSSQVSCTYSNDFIMCWAQEKVFNSADPESVLVGRVRYFWLDPVPTCQRLEKSVNYCSVWNVVLHPEPTKNGLAPQHGSEHLLNVVNSCSLLYPYIRCITHIFLTRFKNSSSVAYQLLLLDYF